MKKILILQLCFILTLTFNFACNNKVYLPDTSAKIEKAPDIGSAILVGTFFSLKSFGYEQEEFFFSGTAYSYENTAPLGSDGKWEVSPADTATYKTRMMVYRPIDPADFNGTVIVEWLNVSGGMDTPAEWMMLHTEILRRGYAWVGISAQYMGVEGGETSLPSPLGTSLPLKLINYLRYKSLSHPGDSFSYDIFSQAVSLIRYPDSEDTAPLGEFEINRLIAAGESQSAIRMITFVNAFGKDIDYIDGYFIHSRLGYNPEFRTDFGGGSAPLSQSPQTTIYTPEVVIVREDLGKPVMNLQTETDMFMLGAYTSRQDDSDTFRLWEVAGSAHADLYTTSLSMFDTGGVSSAEISITKQPIIIMPCCPESINSAPQHHFTAKAALNALNMWLTDGMLPPSAPRLTVNTSGDGFEYDSFGNVLGGVRSPYVDVPIARFSGENSSVLNDTDICFLYGETEMLDDATLNFLYPDHDTYVDKVTRSAENAVINGFLLQEDAELIITAAEESDIPPQ